LLVIVIFVIVVVVVLSIDEAITAYTRLSEDVFSNTSVLSQTKTNASLLENATAKIINSALNVDESQAWKMRVLDDNGPK